MTVREGQTLPEPSRVNKRRPSVVPLLQIALKAAFSIKPTARPVSRNVASLVTWPLPKAQSGAC